MTPPFLLFSSRHWLPPHIFFPLSCFFNLPFAKRGMSHWRVSAKSQQELGEKMRGKDLATCPRDKPGKIAIWTPACLTNPPGESRRTAMTACLAVPKATPLHAYSLFIQTKPCWRPNTFLLWFGTKFGRNNGLAEWAVTEAMSRQHSWWWSGFKSCLFHNGYDYAEVIRAYMIYIMDASEGNTPPFSLP